MALMPPLTPQGTMRVPLATLTQLLQQGRRIVGVSVTPSGTHEVVSVGPPSWRLAAVLNRGSSLTPEHLKLLVHQQQAGALVLGGSALFRADGSMHFGVRKLISAVMGLAYAPGEALPRPLPGAPCCGGPAPAPPPSNPWGLHAAVTAVAGSTPSVSYRPLHQQQQRQQWQLQWAPGVVPAPPGAHPQQQPQQPMRYQPLHQQQHPGHLQHAQHAQHVQQQRWFPSATPLGMPAWSHAAAKQQHQQLLHRAPAQHVITPILLCRENEDDAGVMLTRYIKRHSGAAFPSMAWERWTSAS